MARQPGIRAEETTAAPDVAGSIVRGVGFAVLAGLAMAIIAPLVLLPAYANAIRAEHDLARKRAEVAHNRKIVAAGARLNSAIPHDRVINERLIKGTVRSGLLNIPNVNYPPKPNGWLLNVADRVSRPKTRRGLFFAACVSMAGAMFLFAPPAVRPASRSRRAT